MSDKTADKQFSLDEAVFAAAGIYFDYGMYCWMKADCDNNREEINIDVIAAGNPEGEKGWGIAFETVDSVSENQAYGQWLQHSENFDHWYLAVPVTAETNAAHILKKCNIDNCSLITWQKDEDETYSFMGLPGLPSGPHKKRSMYKNLSPRKASMIPGVD